jgi:hypothetical protein
MTYMAEFSSIPSQIKIAPDKQVFSESDAKPVQRFDAPTVWRNHARRGCHEDMASRD